MTTNAGFPQNSSSHGRFRETRFLLAAFFTLLLAASTLLAQTATEPLLLRSIKGHQGNVSWIMLPATNATGAEISQTNFDIPSDAQPAIVPGTVLNSLVANGVYPEPYFGLNNAHEKNLIPDLSETGPDFYTYWFRTEFETPKAFHNRRVWLQLDGINYRAEIWLNGKRVGDLAGMFQRGVFDVTEIVHRDQANALAIRVRPVDIPGGFRAKNKTVRAMGENRNGGDGEIGRNTTMLMSVGWDFTFTDGIRDRNTGIWRDVKLFATGPVALRNPFVKSHLPLPALAPAREEISVEVVNATQEPQQGLLKAQIPEAKIKIEKSISLAAGETKTVFFTPDEFKALTISKPRLWWPMNKGEQFLHHLKLEFVQGETVSDRAQLRFGIREVSSNRDTPDGSRQFLVNGKRIFLHGSNWIPEAMCRNSDERTYAELRYTKQAGVNFLRFWAGGVTESDYFFDLCDQFGILVWTEFWLTGDTQLPRNPNLYRTNVTDTIQRIRNHPSLAYYVSANERGPRNIIPIADLVEKLDGTRGYQTGSEVDGIHDGSPYVAENPMFYYEDTGSARGSRINGLCPEYGCPILPTIDALREMMPEKDLWPINNETWNYLDGGGFHGMTGNYKKCVDQYGPSDSIESFAWKAQAFGALAYRSIWEVWTENKFDYGDRFSTGLLFWYHNSPNRQVCGRMWDWSLEPTAALYFTQNAHQPLHAQFDFIKNTVSVNNEFPREFKNGKVTIRVLNLDMTEVLRLTTNVNISAEGLAKDILKVQFPTNVSPVHFLKLEITDAKGAPVSETFYWRSNHDYKPGRTWTGPLYEGFEDLSKLPQVALDAKAKWSRRGKFNICTVTVKNPSKDLAFLVWLRLQDAASGKPVRPAFYENNFVSLLPGESRKVEIEFADTAAVTPKTKLVVDGWNVKRRELRP
ncbi:MAG TPA: glycoside hydrolase family 2 [Verrucomicrobiae bacterium]|nr:glycoside hydrolase family 2 [Verrucomicrobiae bacterium]